MLLLDCCGTLKTTASFFIFFLLAARLRDVFFFLPGSCPRLPSAVVLSNPKDAWPIHSPAYPCPACTPLLPRDMLQTLRFMPQSLVLLALDVWATLNGPPMSCPSRTGNFSLSLLLLKLWCS